MIMKENIDVKYTSPKNTVSQQYGRENVYEVPWPTARARVPREDAVRTKGLGTEATPRNHTILGASREKTKVLS